MHGGKSTGRPITQGLKTKQASHNSKDIRRIISVIQDYDLVRGN